MLDTAIILAGGKGLRLRPLTNERPKPMVLVAGRPIIEWIILWLKKSGITLVVLGVNYKKEVLIDYLGAGERYGIRIKYVSDREDYADTGGALRNIMEKTDLPETFLVLNGDQITDISIPAIALYHRAHSPLATIITCPVRIPYGIVDIAETGAIRAFMEKPVIPHMFMSTGIYIFEKEMLAHLPQKGAVEKTTFEKLSSIGKLYAHTHRGFFTTISDQKDLAEVEKQLARIELSFLA